jgi:hypothetical protein
MDMVVKIYSMGSSQPCSSVEAPRSGKEGPRDPAGELQETFDTSGDLFSSLLSFCSDGLGKAWGDGHVVICGHKDARYSHVRKWTRYISHPLWVIG